MRAALYIAILAASLLLPALAEAQDWTPAPASVNAAVLNYKAPIIPGQEIRIGPCPMAAAAAGPAYMAGCTWAIPADMPIYIVNPADRWTLAHEYGHRFMGSVMMQRDLARLARIIRSRRPIRAYSERGADIYAACALGLRPRAHRGNGLDRIDPNFPTAHGYSPTRHQHARVCALLWRVGERSGLH